MLSSLNFLFATAGLILLIISIILYFDYFYQQSKLYNRFVKNFTWQAIIIITTGGVATSLLYSEYFGFIPCSLCWLQRIALYPQALFSLMAFTVKDKIFFPFYGIGLSLFGLIVAIYHYIYQLVPKEVITNGFMPCLADGSSDCTTIIIQEYGIITFPLLSAITFFALIILYLNLRRDAKSD